MPTGFYLNYENTPFLETSRTGANANRLNWRCEILLTRNREAIRSKRVLDMGSHDGRFSYACLKLGAKHVTGIEGRSHLVKHASENLAKLGCSTRDFTFVHGDIFDYLSRDVAGEFGTVLCLGLPTMRQVELFRHVRNLKAEYFILDTGVERLGERALVGLAALMNRVRLGRSGDALCGMLERNVFRPLWSDKAVLTFRKVDHNIEGTTTDDSDLVALPTEPLVEMLLKGHGYRFRRLNWETAGIEDWSNMEDYKNARRASYLAQLA
jgi:hypothetical protein